MNHNDFLERNGMTPRNQRTHDEFMYDLLISPTVNNINSLINDYNSISMPDYSKYGDYSSTATSYLKLSFKADEVMKSLSQLKGRISEEEYKKLRDTVNDIKWYSDKNRMNAQSVNEFYSKFEDEKSYTTWKTDLTFSGKYGELTAAEVTKLISQREAQGYGKDDSELKWLRDYDLNHGYKNEKYYTERIYQLKQSGDTERIKELEAKRNVYKLDNTFAVKSYDKLLNYGDPEFEKNVNFGKKIINNYPTHFGQKVGNPTGTKLNLADALNAIDNFAQVDLLHEDEKNVLYYIIGKHGFDSAAAYMDDMSSTLNRRQTQQEQQWMYERMTAGGLEGFLSSVVFNAVSVPVKSFGSLMSAGSIVNDILSGESIDVYSDGFKLTNLAKAVRTAQGEAINNDVGNFFYQTSMSILDSAFNMLVFKGGANIVSGLGAGADRMVELAEQGASDKEILIGGVTSAVIEMAAEKIPLDNLLKNINPSSPKEFFQALFKQAGIEFVEETITEATNKAADNMLRGSMSDYNRLVKQYVSEGYTQQEAENKAFKDAFYDVVLAGVGGFLSGAIMGSVAGGSQMYKFNVIGTNIIEGNNVDTVLMAAEYMGSLDPEIKGQVQALNKFKESAKSGKANTAYKRTLGKVAATVAENVTEVKQSVTEKAVSNELKNRGVDSKTIGKVSKIVSKFLSGQKLSSSEQGYLQHNSVAATVMHEIEAAQEQVKAGSLPQSPTATAPSSDGANAQGSAPQWAVDLVNKLTTIDSAMSVINLSASGKSTDNTHNSDVNRMIKILSIASGKTTAEQEAEAGDIPYSQYIREKEAAEKEAAEKQNTAENGGEVESTETKIVNSFGITKLSDTLHVQKKVIETLKREGFWENEEEHSTTIVNNDSKMDIVINESGIEETFSYKHFTRLPKDLKIKKLITVRKLPQIIQNGTMVSDDIKNYHDTKSSVKYAYIECAVEIDGELSVITVAIRKSPQKNKFWVHQVDIKKDAGSTPAGTSESSKTGYPTSDSTVIISSDEFVVNKNVADDMSAEEDFNGFNEPDVSEDGVTYESRLLHTMRGEKITTEGQAYIKKICKNLGIEVVFENVFTPKGKHADGYIDSNGVIHLDYHCSNPVEFVLKHELTHYGESSALYSNFCKAVISSEAFAQWINGKVEGDGNVTLKAAEYREQISRLYEKNGVKLSPAKQQSEMIANFVGEVLFSKDTNGLERLTANMPIKQKRSVIDFIKDFIVHIKEKLTKVKGVSSEILSLERKFNRLLSSAEQNKTADEGGNKYSIEYVAAKENVQITELLNKVKQGSFKPSETVYLKDVSEAVAKKIYEETGIDVKEFKVAVEARQLEHILNDHGAQGKADHSMSNDSDIAKIEYVLDSPNEISYSGKTQAYSSFINGYNRTADTVLYEKEIGDKSYYVVQAVPVTKKKTLFIVSAFIGEKGYKKETLRLNNAKSPVATPKIDSAKVSNDRVPQNDTTVNSNSMQEAGDYSVEADKISSNNEGQFSIPYENEIVLSEEQEKYFKDSVVRNEDGSLKVMYHGTSKGGHTVFDTYGSNYGLFGQGTYFTDNREVAESYTLKGKGSNPKVYEAYLNVIKPMDMDAQANAEEWKEAVPDAYFPTSGTNEEFYRAMEEYLEDEMYSKWEAAAFAMETIQGMGYDGISHIGGGRFNKSDDTRHRVYIVFEPEQIKDVNNLNPTNDSDINFSIPNETTEEKSSSEVDITDIPDLMAEISAKHKNGELTDEEYRIEVQDLLLRANEKYGSIEQGEKAENKTQIPKRVTSNKSEKTKRWVRTVHESGILPEDMEVELDAQILKDAMSYQIIGDKAAQTQANAAIQRGTAQKEWEAAVNGEGQVGKREIAIGETLLKLAAERKDEKSVMKLIAEVSEMGTRAGQVVQAMSMLKKMDGIGQLYYVQKCVERINRDLDKRFARKLKKGKLDIIPQVKINETLANQLAASKTAEDFDVTYEAMMQSIAEQVPSTFLDKWNAWRYFAMLFNPRTHIRNYVGNYGFVPAVRFKDALAAVAETWFVDESKRTKSAIVKKEYREFALNDFSEVEDIITGSGKMNPSDEIRDRQNVFDTKWLENLRKWNFDLLEKEDAIFLKKHYSHALGGFLQARNIDLSKDIDRSVMEEARKYAMVEAQKATYRDASKAATVISNFTRRGGIVGNLVEGVLPFKKTPINIVKRGIEYSPIGLIKTLTKGTYDLVNENITASQYIDGIAGGLTGTGIVVLGALLSSLGFIKITGGFDDDEEDDLNRLLGRQEYAVEIGGASYTIDWMAPVCIPFFMGVEIQKALEEEDNGNLWQSFKNVAGNALEPIINLSMLSGMQDAISSAKYSEGSAVVGSVLWDIVLSYGSQALPTIGGSVARTIDGTRRTTYIDKTSWMSDMGQMALNKIESKIPGVSMLRSEYVDEFGRTEDSGNVFGRAIQNFVSPGYYSKIEDDPVIEELKDLYEKTGESVLPSKPKKYISVGGEKIHLTADEYEEYAKEVGQDRYDYVKEFINSSLYRTLTDAEKREVISDLYSYAQAKGKTHYSEYKLPDLYTKVYEAEKNGISPVEYYASKIATSVDNADTDGSGTVTKKEKLAAIRKMNVSNDIKAALIALYS